MGPGGPQHLEQVAGVAQGREVGAATTTISSAPISMRRHQADQACGTSRTMQGTLARSTSITPSKVPSEKSVGRSRVAGAASRLRLSVHFDRSRSTKFASTRSGANTASATPCGGSWLKLRPAVPKATSRSAITVAVPKSRATDQAMWGERRGADAALGADHRDGPAEGLGGGIAEQLRDRRDHRHGIDRRDQVLAHAPADELAVEHHVVDVADHHHLGAGVADLGQAVEGREGMGPPGADLHHDDVGRGGAAEGLDGRGGAAHLDAGMRLLHPPVAGRRLDRRRDLGALAEGLHGDAGDRRDDPAVDSPGSDMVRSPPAGRCPSARSGAGRLVAGAALVRPVVISLSHLALDARATILLPSV